MRYLMVLIMLLISGCDAMSSYPKHRLNEQITDAGNKCLDHGGIDRYKIRVREDNVSFGPIVGVTCMDEKYFEISIDSN